jgi:hypothetical protein
MKHLLASAALVVVSWSAPLLGYAADAVGTTLPVKAKATVQAIYPGDREVTFKTEAGQVRTVSIAPSVTNLDKLRIGDVVTVTYTEGVAVAVRDPEVEQEAGRDSPTANPEAKPGEYTHSTTIESVDPAAGLVTFVGRTGRLRTVTVTDPEVRANLDKVKPGDTVELIYMDPVATTVEMGPGQ